MAAPTIGHSRFDDHAAGFATVTAAWGSLVGIHTTGTRRQPARASAPAVRSLPGVCAVGYVRPDAVSSDPTVGSDTAALPFLLSFRQGGHQLTAATGDPSLVAAVPHAAGVS